MKRTEVYVRDYEVQERQNFPNEVINGTRDDPEDEINFLLEERCFLIGVTPFENKYFWQGGNGIAHYLTIKDCSSQRAGNYRRKVKIETMPLESDLSGELLNLLKEQGFHKLGD